MWSEADRDLVRRDVALPGLGILLDEARFLALLDRINPGLGVTSATLGYLRYKPGTNCLAGYRVEVGGRTVWVHGKTWSGDAGVKLGKHRERTPPAGAGILAGGVDAAAGVAVKVFPSDAKLPGLGAWVDAQERVRFLAGRAGLEALAGTAGLEVLHYKPERRWVGRLRWADGRPAAVVKVHTPEGFASAYAASRAIRGGLGYGVPRLLGRSRRRSAMVLRWEEGEGMGGVAVDGVAGARCLRDLGAALAEFHGQGVLGLREMSVERLASRVMEEAGTLGWLVPGFSSRARRLAEHLASVIVRSPAACTTVHGDFHPGQVLRGPGGMVFLDLDEAATAPGWTDLARFLAHLEADAVRGLLREEDAVRTGGEILEGYQSSTGVRLTEGLPALVAAELLSLAVQFFRNRECGWQPLLEKALARAEVLGDGTLGLGSGGRLDSGERPTASRVGGGRVVDEAMPFLGRALDVGWMEARFRAVSPDLSRAMSGSRLAAAEVVRHKPGRRCLIRYSFEPLDGGVGFVWLGKTRSRPGRVWASRAGRALRLAGLGEGSDVSVPEPLGEVPELHLELQRQVQGEGVLQRLEGMGGAGWMGRCADAVERLHRSGVVLARGHSMRDEMTILRERLREVEGTRPGYADRIGAVREACEGLAGTLLETEPCLIHRDYHPEQVLVEGGRLWLLDLDLCAMGDPMIDHGNFLAHLIEWSLRRRGTAGGMREEIGAYREAALSGGGRMSQGERRLEGCVTLSLVRHLQICTRFPDREPWLPCLLEVCEERLSLGARAVCV